jgi:hypothetical protein
VEKVHDRGDRGAPRRGIQVDESRVYWSEIVTGEPGKPLTVFAAPKGGGGTPRALGEWTDYQAPGLVQDAAHLYWLRAGKLLRVRKDGSGTTELAVPDVDTIDPGPLHDAGDAVLVGSHACLFLARIPKDGSPAKLWRVSQRKVTGGNTGLAVDGSRYYCSSGNHVHVLDSATGEARELVAYQGSAGPLRKVGQDLYWNDLRPPDAQTASLALLAAGATVPVSVTPSHGDTASIVHDRRRNTLYWLTGLNHYGCKAGAYDLERKEGRLLASDLDVYGASTDDDDHLYWLASNAVMRLRK